MQESVGAPKTVDGDFESRKAEYKRFTTEYGVLFRRLEHYFKQIKEDARNFEKVTETTRSIYTGTTEVSETFDALSQKTLDALAAYETAWTHTKDLMQRYDAIIKHVGKRIQERDGCRVDFDRARSKWEKNTSDTVAEATARASEQVYLEKHHSVSDNLDFFLSHRFEHMDASYVLRASLFVCYCFVFVLNAVMCSLEFCCAFNSCFLCFDCFVSANHNKASTKSRS